MDLRVQGVPGLARVELVGGGQPGDHRAAQVPGWIPPGEHHPLHHREAGVAEQKLGVDLPARAQPAAVFARSEGRVEGELARFQFRQAGAAFHAGVVLAEEPGVVFAANPDPDDALGGRQGGLDRVGEAAAVGVAHREAVYDDGDVVVLVPIERGRMGEVVYLAIDERAHEAGAPRPLEQLAELALASTHQGGEDLDLAARLPLQKLLDDLGGALTQDRPAALRAVGDARARPQQAQVVVDFGDRAHRRARVPVHRLLLDGNRRREALDGVDIRLLHQAQELAGVRGQRFHVTPLSLGIDGVEGEGGFPRS